MAEEPVPVTNTTPPCCEQQIKRKIEEKEREGGRNIKRKRKTRSQRKRRGTQAKAKAAAPIHIFYQQDKMCDV